jgi:hypothetical protein
MAELPVTCNLKAYRGDTWSQTFRFVYAGAPLDLTGATVACWATTARDVPATLPCAVGTPATDGMVTITMPIPELGPGAYSYDVEVVDSSGAVTTWVRGRLQVEQDVTNAA